MLKMVLLQEDNESLFIFFLVHLYKNLLNCLKWNAPLDPYGDQDQWVTLIKNPLI